MESEISYNPKPTQEREYPWLGIHEKTDDGVLVVLFEGGDCGTVVYSDSDDGWEVGQFYDGWHMKEFIEFQGQIVLSND